MGALTRSAVVEAGHRTPTVMSRLKDVNGIDRFHVHRRLLLTAALSDPLLLYRSSRHLIEEREA